MNVTNESLLPFAGIVPCGISDGGVTSIERASGTCLRVEEAASRVAAPFVEVFSREIMR